MKAQMTAEDPRTKRTFSIPDDLYKWAKDVRVPQLNARHEGKFDMTHYFEMLLRRDRATCNGEGGPIATDAKRPRTAPRKAVA